MFDWVHNVPILSILCYLPLGGCARHHVRPEERSAGDDPQVRDHRRVRRLPRCRCPSGSPSTASGELFQFRESAAWIPSIGVRYDFGIDGITLLLVLLTTLLGVLAVLSSWSAIHTREKEYYVFLLLLETGMIGVFWRSTSSCSTSSGKSCWCRCTS